MQVDLGIAGTDVKVHVVNPGVFDTELFHLPDNDPTIADLSMLPVEAIVEPVLEQMRSGAFELYVPEWFGEIAAGKPKNPEASSPAPSPTCANAPRRAEPKPGPSGLLEADVDVAPDERAVAQIEVCDLADPEGQRRLRVADEEGTADHGSAGVVLEGEVGEKVVLVHEVALSSRIGHCPWNADIIARIP